MKTLQNYITDSLSIDEASLLDIEGSIKEGDVISAFDTLKDKILNKSSYFVRYGGDSYVLEINDVDNIFNYFNIKYKKDASILITITKYDVEMNIYDYEWCLDLGFYSGDNCITNVKKTFYTKQMMFSKFLETKIEPLFKDLKSFNKLIDENK